MGRRMRGVRKAQNALGVAVTNFSPAEEKQGRVGEVAKRTGEACEASHDLGTKSGVGNQIGKRKQGKKPRARSLRRWGKTEPQGK